MTYRERWEKENPGKPYSTRGCPKGPDGFEVDCPDGITDCGKCWNREIPEDKTEIVHFEYGTAGGLKIGHILENEEGVCVMTDVPSNQAGENIMKLAKTMTDACFAEDGYSPTIKDSGSTTEFDTGAHRDAREGKGRCDLLPLEVVSTLLDKIRDGQGTVLHNIARFQNTQDTYYLYNALERFSERNGDKTESNRYCTMLLEVAKHYEEGANKYGADNWKKGMPVHIYIDSAIRHYLKWLRGDKDEPHDRAFVWNIMCCIWEVDYSNREKQ